MTETIQSRAYVNVTDKQWRKIFGVPPYTKSKTQTIVTTPDGNAFSTEKGNEPTHMVPQRDDL